MKYFILLILVLVGCTPNIPPSPTPTPGPKVMEFKLEGKTVILEGRLKNNVSLTSEEAQKQLAIAVELIDK